MGNIDNKVSGMIQQFEKKLMKRPPVKWTDHIKKSNKFRLNYEGLNQKQKGKILKLKEENQKLTKLNDSFEIE